MPTTTSQGSDHPADLPWDNVALGPLSAADAADFHGWQNDPRLRDLTMGYRWPIQQQSVEEWIEGLRSQQDRAVYGIRAGGQLAGMVHLHGMDFPNRACNLGIFVAGAEGFRGPDLCRMGGALLIDYAFCGFNMRRITIETLAINQPIRSIAESLGFQLEGTRRAAHFADGAYWDIALYGMLEEEFTGAPPAMANRLSRRMRKPGLGGG
jgi:RimJ/RimL family protein N-acetyltransferase